MKVQDSAPLSMDLSYLFLEKSPPKNSYDQGFGVNLEVEGQVVGVKAQSISNLFTDLDLQVFVFTITDPDFDNVSLASNGKDTTQDVGWLFFVFKTFSDQREQQVFPSLIQNFFTILLLELDDPAATVFPVL